jgi:transposase
MARAEVFSDELWALIEPAWPSPGTRAGRPWNDHRLTLEGIVWRYRVGAPWAGCAGGLRDRHPAGLRQPDHGVG